MLSSNSSSCCNHNPNFTPFSENDITSLSFTSESENPNFLFGLIPNSPHFDDYLHFLDHAYLNTPPADYLTSQVPAVAPGGGAGGGAAASAAAPPSKKDRHSKINTARGPRDRRMRLSLDIARQFFDLQDRLGFDKASRTVDWLLRSASSAIRALTRGRAGSQSESCTSEDYCGGEAAARSSSGIGKSRRGKRGKSKGGVQQKQKRTTVERESRRKARERARERTSQKRRLMRESGVPNPMYGAAVPAVEDLSSDEARPWNSFYLHENTHHAAFFHQDERIEEFEFNGKPWEDYSGFNMSA